MNTHRCRFLFAKVHQLCSRKISSFCGKVALVTGGASGIGFQIVRTLLARGAKAVTIADINESRGEKALKCLVSQYGPNKALFVECDVSKPDFIEWAFKNTVSGFGCVDMVIHNAGIINDKDWEVELITNINGTVTTNLLALQYMSTTCNGKGGQIVNIISTTAVDPLCGCPIYSMTQGAILNFTRALGLGEIFGRTGCKVMGLLAGRTETQAIKCSTNNMLNEKFTEEYREELKAFKPQSTEHVACAVADLIEHGNTGDIWGITDAQEPFEVQFTDEIEQMKVPKYTCCKPEKTVHKIKFCELYDRTCDADITDLQEPVKETICRDYNKSLCCPDDKPNDEIPMCGYRKVNLKKIEDVVSGLKNGAKRKRLDNS